MDCNIHDIEFRKAVLKLSDEGYTAKEVAGKLNTFKSRVDDVLITFKYLPIDATINKGAFSKEDIKYMEEHINDSWMDLIIGLNRSYVSIKNKIEKMRKNSKVQTIEDFKSKNIPLNKGKRFSDEDINFIREAYLSGSSIEDISNALSREEESIKNIIWKKEIHKEKVEEVIPEGHKRCRCCKEIKPIYMFAKNKSKKDGLGLYCNDCNNKKYREYYKKHKKNGDK